VKRAIAFAAVAAMFAETSTANAGGFYLLDRGVRANGRAGAFVAGADDPSAITYNPAGLAWSGRQLLLDAAYPVLFADYTRVDSGGVRQPTVEAGQVPLPLPSLAYSDHFGLRDFTFGVGIFAPTATLLKWPESIDLGNGTRGPAPQRYSLMSMQGTILANAMLSVAYQPIDQLSIGLSAGVVTGTFAARTTISSCDGVICTQPEDPDYDAVTQVNAANLIAPAATLGITYAATHVRIGASVSTPYRLRGDTALEARVPSAPIFDQSTIENGQGGAPRATVSLRFPWVIRAGVEVRPTDRLRMEAAGVIETWSRQNEIRLTPHDVYVRDVFAVGDYQLGPIVIPRHMKNTISLRAGGEYTIGAHRRVTLRAGLSYETSSFSNAYLSPLTLDSDKLSGLGGMSINVGEKVSLDGTFGYIWMRNRNVTNSRVTQPNAIRPDADPPVYIGNGRYRMDALYIGAGLRIRFAPPVREQAEPVEETHVEEPVEEPVVTGPGDTDHDGILDPSDQCVTQAEDRDEFQDDDGCPDLDDDMDNIADTLDACRLQPEDADGYEDADGCPENDNDGDGVTDQADACPTVAGPPENRGCPDADRDGDTVVDRRDNCPDESGPVENHGCRVQQRVVIEGDRLEILEKVYFRRNSHVIDRRSFALLDQIAAVIVAHPELGVIAVEGHTDATGNAARNTALSTRRANSVRDYLVGRGADPARITAVGFGPDRPVVPNASTPEEHEANRRVEFRLGVH